MPTYILANFDGVPALHELTTDEEVLAIASLRRNPEAENPRRRSFIRLVDGQDVVLRTEYAEPSTKDAA